MYEWCLVIGICLSLRRCLMNILSNFYNTDIITDPKYKFSTSGSYYAPPKGNYEAYVDFIKELPMTQAPEVFGMDDNVDISKELQETRLFFDSIILTQSQRAGGGGGKTEDALKEIATDILSKVLPFMGFSDNIMIFVVCEEENLVKICTYCTVKDLGG